MTTIKEDIAVLNQSIGEMRAMRDVLVEKGIGMLQQAEALGKRLMREAPETKDAVMPLLDDMKLQAARLCGSIQ